MAEGVPLSREHPWFEAFERQLPLSCATCGAALGWRIRPPEQGGETLSQVLEEAPEQDGSMQSEESVESQDETQFCWVQYERAIRGLPWEQ